MSESAKGDLTFAIRAVCDQSSPSRRNIHISGVAKPPQMELAMVWVNWVRTIFMLALDLGLGAGLFTYFRQADSGSIDAVDDPSPTSSDDIAAVPVGVGEEYAPLGLSRLRPYRPGKIPVVLIHGLGATSRSWTHLVEKLDADPVIRRHYRFWTFGYTTGDPILYSAFHLRQALLDSRRELDPDHSDPAFDRMILIGHSMGGLLAKLVAADSHLNLWHSISARPARRMAGPEADRELIRQCFIFTAVPEVERVIYMATPHLGSPTAQGALRWVVSRVIRPGDPLRRAYQSVIASNPPGFFRERFRAGIPSSVDQLTWKNQRLMDLRDMRVNPRVAYHSIIADLNDPPRLGGSDGLVPYASAHLEGAHSELLVHGSHLCQASGPVVRECRRLLREHLTALERHVEERAPAHGPGEIDA
jgi:pimeloyl-ACP methyl ester carboxylesterase